MDKISIKKIEKSVDKIKLRCYYKKVLCKEDIKDNHKTRTIFYVSNRKNIKKHIKLLAFLCLKK